MLMQGLELSDVRPCSSSQLPPPMTCPSSLPPPSLEPFIFEELEDTYGQALLWTSGSTKSTRTSPTPQGHQAAPTLQRPSSVPQPATPPHRTPPGKSLLHLPLNYYLVAIWLSIHYLHLKLPAPQHQHLYLGLYHRKHYGGGERTEATS